MNVAGQLQTRRKEGRSEEKNQDMDKLLDELHLEKSDKQCQRGQSVVFLVVQIDVHRSQLTMTQGSSLYWIVICKQY